MTQGSTLRGSRIRLDTAGMRRARRTVLEQVLVAVPALARALAAGRAALPLRSPLRRFLTVRLTVQAAAAVNRRDFEVLFAGFDPEIDYQGTGGAWGMVAPDMAGNHHGHGGYRAVWERWLEAFSDMTLEPEELIDLGDRLIAVTLVRAHGTGSGAPIDQYVFQVFFFRRGLVVKQQDFPDMEAALEAAAAGR